VLQTKSDASPSDLHTRLILANALMVTDGMGAERRREMEAAYANALKHGLLDEKLHGLCVLWADESRRCRYAAAERLIEEADFLETPGASRAHRLTALWLKGMTDHLVGRQARACQHLRRLLREYSEDAGREFLRQFGYDVEAAAATILGLCEFLRGNPVEAFAANDRAVAKARTLSSPVTVGAALRWRATMLYFFDEDGLEVDRVTHEVLPTEAFFHPDGRPEGSAIAVHGLWRARDGDWVQGVELVKQGLGACLKADYLYLQSLVRAEIALQLIRHGAREQADEFTVALEDDHEENGWSTPEVLRIRGEIAERCGDAVLAEVRFREALALAEHQQVQTWHLRAAISLAALWLRQGRASDAAALLEQVSGRLPSIADWPLARRASDLLDACRAASGGVDRSMAATCSSA
jgi:tetratricopeptide (TPR) repeat protein